MFFKQVRKNAAGALRENGLFFGSLVIAIVAFYTLLSLEKQDVMIFLSTIESDALEKLFALIPLVYVVSLFFVFFLVYFACSYQTDRRKKEFGLYLMLGMKRSRLFAMLFCEMFLSSLFSLVIGLPVSFLLTEGLSLATSKFIGLGIIGHKLSLSFQAVLWTICGFILVQFLSMLIICFKFSRKEPADFMRTMQSEKLENLAPAKSSMSFAAGVIFLLSAYAMGVFLLNDLGFIVMLAILVFGAAGTFLLYYGLGGFLGRGIVKKNPEKSGLYTFTARQIQENVLNRHKSLAICSLLLLVSLASVSYGMGVADRQRNEEPHTTDFSILGSPARIEAVLEDSDIKALTEVAYPVFLTSHNAKIDCAGLVQALEKLPQTDTRDNIIQNVPQSIDYVISLSSYNNMLKAMGKEPLALGENELALFSSMDRSGSFPDILSQALKNNAYLELNGTAYKLLPDLYRDNIVADRSITLYLALIAGEELFNSITEKDEPFCWNIHLDRQFIEENGLMQAIAIAEPKIAAFGLEYDSYIKGIGRTLFYTISASYLTIYLGILFLLIANTVIGIKYLIQQSENKRRYITLLTLGAEPSDIVRSVNRQISMFFFMALSVAAVSSVFAIISMYGGFMGLSPSASVWTLALISASVFAMFIIIEIIYVNIVKRKVKKEIMSLDITDRG